MTLTVLGAVSEAGAPGLANEDGYGTCGDFAWVIDGATGLSDDPLIGEVSDAAWLAEQADAALRAHAPDATDPGRLLASAAIAVAKAFAAAQRRPARERYEIPTAAVLLAQFRQGTVEIVELGDCAVYLRPRAGDTDEEPPELARVGGTASGRRAEQASARRLMMRGEGRTDAVRRVLRAARNRANAPDGYPIFAPDPHCTERARRVSLPLPAGTAVLMTDGFEAALEDYRLYDPDAFFDASVTDPHRVLSELRAIEAADPDLVRFPRFKPSDDATALALAFD